MENKKLALEPLAETRAYFESGDVKKKEAYAHIKRAIGVVEKAIDRLETVKDSVAYTFAESLKHALSRYFFYEANNPKEEKRFARQTEKHDKLLKKGK